MDNTNHKLGHTLAVPRTEKTTDVWLSPKFIIDALGPFDLDPAHEPVRPFETAAHYFTEADDGLKQDWSGYGIFYANPPYNPKYSKQWMSKCAQHGNGIVLVFAKCETLAWQIAWRNASAILFLDKRIQFLLPTGELPPKNAQGNRPGPGAGSALIAFGEEAARRLRDSGLSGQLVTGWQEIGGPQTLFDDADTAPKPQSAAFPVLLDYDADGDFYSDAMGLKWRNHEGRFKCRYCNNFEFTGWRAEDELIACDDCVTV